jgi:hypothetical protein
MEEPHIVDLRQLCRVAVVNKIGTFWLASVGSRCHKRNFSNQQEISMAKTLGMLFGIVFLAIGILGFVPGITTNDMLLGIFMVNKAHSIVHIASGAIFLIASMSGAGAARLWFQIFGLIYAVVAIMGFVVGNGMIFNLISNNTADTWLHVVLAVVMLLIGFGTPKQTA